MTQLRLNFYGQFSETYQEHRTLEVSMPLNVSDLKAILESEFDLLKTIQYRLAQNDSFKNDSDAVDHTSIDVFPPFSGG